MDANRPAPNPATVSTVGLLELVEAINFRIAHWQDFGYEFPPTPESAHIPPLGQRSGGAIEAGHQAVREIEQLIAQLHGVRAQLIKQIADDAAIRHANGGTL